MLMPSHKAPNPEFFLSSLRYVHLYAGNWMHLHPVLVSSISFGGTSHPARHAQRVLHELEHRVLTLPAIGSAMTAMTAMFARLVYLF